MERDKMSLPQADFKDFGKAGERVKFTTGEAIVYLEEMIRRIKDIDTTGDKEFELFVSAYFAGQISDFSVTEDDGVVSLEFREV